MKKKYDNDVFKETGTTGKTNETEKEDEGSEKE